MLLLKNLLAIVLVCIPMLGLGQPDYLNYHSEVTRAEELIAAKKFKESILVYRSLLDTYSHVFLRDIKVAAQLSAYLNDPDVFYFLEQGMRRGWNPADIMKIEILKRYKKDERWKKLLGANAGLDGEFQSRINIPLRNEVREMLHQDQKRALRVALTPVRRWRENYTNRKFVPQNRRHVRRINQIIDEVGFPGEKIIGDRSWATVLLSHNEHDSIYTELRPKLFQAFHRGELSAIELAIIETWRVAVDTDRKDKGFIIWGGNVSKEDAVQADSLRRNIGLRSIALNNQLLDIEKELGFRLFLSPFHGGYVIVGND